MDNVARKWTICALLLAAAISVSGADKPASLRASGVSTRIREAATLSVAITPAGPIPTNVYCTFTANVSGGVPGYHYAWYVNNSPIGTDSQYLSYLNHGPFRIQVFVTDADGTQANDSKIISTGGSSCS